MDRPLSENEFLYQKHKHSLDILDAVGDLSQVLEKKQNPHQCPQCRMRFKYDIALLRHQRKTGHQNPQREIRQKNRYFRSLAKQYQCHCSQKFAKNIQLRNHQKYCGKKPQNSQPKPRGWELKCFQQFLTSDLRQAKFSFTIVQQNTIQQTTDKRKCRTRVRLSQQNRAKLAKEFKKYKTLRPQAIQRLSRRFGISKGSIRKYFYEYKRRFKQEVWACE